MNGIFSAETMLDIQYMLIEWESYLSDLCVEENSEAYKKFLIMRNKYGFTRETLHKGLEKEDY